MGQFFDPVQLTDWNRINTLFSPDALTIQHNQALASDSAPGQAQANVLIAQNTGASGSQDLIDRATLRDLAPGLAARNQNALATAASLPGVSGNTTVNSLSTMDSQTAASKLAALQYTMGLPQMPGSAAPTAPGAAGSGGAVPDGFLDQMSGSESGGNAGAVNRQGYSGNFQFGSGRLSDLGMYQPVPGENPNGNQWHGTFNVPGFPDVQTHADFVHGPIGPDGQRNQQRGADAQRMAAEIHFGDIANTIDNTPGAQDYNRAGLMAVAQLGGVAGMLKFIATGGAYNPGDNPNAPGGGTHLSDYYTKFSQGGLPAFQGTFGHPSGPLAPNHPARGVQTASAANTAGMPATATDAVPMAAGGNPAPGSTVSDTPDQLQAKLAQMRAGGAGAPVPAAPAAPAPDQPSAAVRGVSQFLQNQLLPQPGAVPNGGTPGTTMTSTDAVSQASKELASQLPGMDPKAANDLVTARAQQLISASQMGMPAPPLSGGPAPAAQSPVPGGSQAAGSVPMNSLLAPSASAANAPRPIIPGSAITTTAPFADQRFPIADQNPSSRAAQQIPAGAQAPAQPGQAAPQGAPAGAPASASPVAQPFNPMAGLPPGTVPINTGYGTPYTQNAPAGFAWARTPAGQLVPYSLTPPVLKIEKTPDALLGLDPRTNQVVSRTPITETGREVFRDTPDGQQGYMNGHPVGAPVPFSGRPEQNEAYKADQKTVAGITANAQAAQGIMPRLNEMAQIQPGLATGLGGEVRSKIQAVLEQMGADPADAAKLTGISSAADADLYRKLATSTAGTAAKADLGANNGVEAMRIYQSANPGMSLQPDANKRITNMLRVQQQSVQDYADAVHDHFDPKEQQFLSGGKYVEPLSSFNRKWQAQANPQVYAAATGILNGDPYAKWADKISNPADAMRAASIAARIDPNITVPIAGGRMQPARALLGAAAR